VLNELNDCLGVDDMHKDERCGQGGYNRIILMNVNVSYVILYSLLQHFLVVEK
jgi:hypothetical protein